MNNEEFDSPEEEIQYLKDVLGQLSEELEDARAEKKQVENDFEDFQENSRLLEKELETSLEQMEKKAADYESRNNRLQRDYDSLRDKYDMLHRQTSTQIAELQSYAKECENQRSLHLTQIRELEQKNDDLERANRQLMSSVQEVEKKLNLAIEKNAILEVEQDETKAMLQRLKDENRDRLQDLKVHALKKKDPEKIERIQTPIDSNKLVTIEADTQTVLSNSPLKISPHVGMQNIPLTPASRINAMNIVGDLLRKVGLERVFCSDCKRLKCDCKMQLS